MKTVTEKYIESYKFIQEQSMKEPGNHHWLHALVALESKIQEWKIIEKLEEEAEK